MTSEVARRILQVIEQERGTLRLTGEASSSTDTPAGLDAPAISPKMSVREMEAELSKREALMRANDGPGESDQWRSERKKGVAVCEHFLSLLPALDPTTPNMRSA